MPPASLAGERGGEPEQRARTPLTGRAAILAVVLLVLVLSFAYPFRGWFDQRAQISQLHERTLAQEARIAELTSDLERWDDPAYVETVARERLRFVMPGEASFVVLGGGDEPAEADALAAPGAGGDWFQQLWTTVAVADDPTLSSDPAPSATETPAVPVTPAPPTGASVLPTP